MLHSEFFSLWVGGKLYFSRVAWNSLNHRLYNAFGVCELFCSLEVCPMCGHITSLWVIRKVFFLKLLQTAQGKDFIMRSVSVAYSESSSVYDA